MVKRRPLPVRSELKTTKIYAIGNSKFPEDLSELYFDSADAKQAAEIEGMKVFLCRIHVQRELK